MTGLLEGHRGMFSSSVHHDDRASWMLELILGDIVDPVVDNDPDIIIPIMPLNFFPGVDPFFSHC